MFLIFSLQFNFAEMIKNKNIDRYIVVVVGFCVVATSGFVGGLLAAENDLKDYLKIQQKRGNFFQGKNPYVQVHVNGQTC